MLRSTLPRCTCISDRPFSSLWKQQYLMLICTWLCPGTAPKVRLRYMRGVSCVYRLSKSIRHGDNLKLRVGIIIKLQLMFQNIITLLLKNIVIVSLKNCWQLHTAAHAAHLCKKENSQVHICLDHTQENLNHLCETGSAYCNFHLL